MQQIRNLIIIIAICLIGPQVQGQNLTPEELIQFHEMDDHSISTILLAKGFKLNEDHEKINGANVNWYFAPFTYSKKDEISSCLTRLTDSSLKSKTIFLLYNPFHFKEFVSNLINLGFQFYGVLILADKVHLFFGKEKYEILTLEKTNSQNKRYYEITLQKIIP
jgi:hypothetical protein